MQHTDLSIMTARFTQDERCTLAERMPEQEIDCNSVQKKIAILMNNTDKEGGMYVYYWQLYRVLQIYYSIQLHSTTLVLVRREQEIGVSVTDSSASER